MSNYYFKNKVNIADYTYIFLCGVLFRNNKKDKREVLSRFLKEQSENNRPIILEKNFMPRYSKTSKMVSYSEAGFSNLYQVEMLVNYLSDINFIILESISTGAEAGMFLGEPRTQAKTCLLLPDEMAIEEDKLGSFLKYSFENSNVNILRFYPQIKKYRLSENIGGWHTYFNKDAVGNHLGEEITDFISKMVDDWEFGFSSSKESLLDGKIYYKIIDDNLTIEICPRTLMICVGALLNCEEYENEFFLNKGHTIIDAESMIVSWLQNTFINSIAELEGKKAKSCTIKINANMEDLSPNRTIGMVLYLLSAAELITISKMKDYDETNKVEFGRKMITVDGVKNKYFYHKYENCIEKMIEKKIIV